MVSSSKVVATDANAIPTGDFIPVEGGMFDFRRAKKISSNWDQTIGACGEGKIYTGLLAISVSLRYLMIGRKDAKGTITVSYLTTKKIPMPKTHCGAIYLVSGSYAGDLSSISKITNNSIK